MKKIPLGIILFFALGAGLFAQPWDPTFYFQRAEQYKTQNDFAKALGMYNSILVREPDNIRALNGRGVIYHKTGELLKAKADFQYAYSLNPALGESKHNLDGVEESLKNSGMGPVNAVAEEYRDAARVLGTNDYMVNGRTLAQVNAGVQPIGASSQDYGYQTQSQNIQIQTMRPEAVLVQAQSGAKGIQSQNAGGINRQQYNSAGGDPRADTYGVGAPSLYDRTIVNEAQLNSLYDRGVASSPGFEDQSRYQQAPQRQNPSASAYTQSNSYGAYTQQQIMQSPPAVQIQTQTTGTNYPPQTQHLYPPARPSSPVTIRAGVPSPVIPGGSSSVQSMRVDTITIGSAENNSPAYFERIVGTYSDAIARNPGFAIAYNNRGVAYARLGDYARALEDFNQALRLNPFYYDAQANREHVKFSMAIK